MRIKTIVLFVTGGFLLASCREVSAPKGRTSTHSVQGTRNVQAEAPPHARTFTVEAKTVPLDSFTESPASLLERNDDGTFLIRITPHVYWSDLGCTIVMDSMGNEFSQIYYLISFTFEEAHYRSIWGVLYGKRPPLALSRAKEYRFLVKPLDSKHSRDEPISCEILKIWDGDSVVFDKNSVENVSPAPGGNEAEPHH